MADSNHRLEDSKSFSPYSFTKIMVKFFRMVICFFQKNVYIKQLQLKNTDKKVSDSVSHFLKTFPDNL